MRLLVPPFLIAALLAGFGCGGSGGYGSAPEDELSLEAGAGISATEQGAETTGEAADGNVDTFTAADLPIEAGHELQFSSNRPGTTTQVSFNLEGPWKFSSGPDQETLTVSMMPKESGFSSDEFPDAQVAAGSSWSTSTDLIEYSFQSKDDNSWMAYGRSDEDGRIVTYTRASRAMVFPMTVGDSWVDGYTEVENGRSTDIIAENAVIARNRLTVPAGSFDAYLLQTKVKAKPRGKPETTTLDYSWFVPGVGRAAEIISVPDENGELFSTASAFYRLKSYR
ncbi:MAG: hypothetical protein Q7K29_02720 [Thermoleophilia bacterium]|nr:hypothetical protein [Thermoleophilia bacterium]